MKRKKKSIAVLLCTYNSEEHLAEQLDSIAKQTHDNWKVWVSDDGSQDNSVEVIENYVDTWGEHTIALQQGPEQGYALNFFSLINNNRIQSDFYAYSDHDDVWQLNKLERATQWLETIPEETPALYCGRTCLVDADLREVGLSMLFRRAPSFANAIVQNIGGGNTMVFNNSARSLLQKVDIENGIIAHDWLTYLVVTACGGKVFYDPSPTIKYRQHANNIVGSNASWKARFKRMKMVLNGTFRNWSMSNIAAAQSLGINLDDNSRAILEHVHQLRNDSVLIRIKELMKLKIYRQTLLGNLGLVVAIIFRRL